MRRYLSAAVMAASLGMPGFAGAEDVDLSNLNDEQVQEAVEFVIGNGIFVMFHEAGHMLVSELGLPVLGREEDAVDALSAILLLEARDDDLDKAMTDAADGWFLSSDMNAEAGEDLRFWGAHGLDEQRAYQMVCMMVGNDADGFKEFADSIDFPGERREECLYEYERTKASWMALLEPHLAPDGDEPQFVTRYEDVEDPELSVYVDLLKSADLLSVVADGIGAAYRLEPGIKLTAKACGQPNAFWHPGERELTYCYELAQWHMTLIGDWLLKNTE